MEKTAFYLDFANTEKAVSEKGITLNAMTASIAADSLVNQYTGHHPHRSVPVYENNERMCIYEDQESLENRVTNCFKCNI